MKKCQFPIFLHFCNGNRFDAATPSRRIMVQMTKLFATVTVFVKLSFLLCFSVSFFCGHAVAEGAPCHRNSHFHKTQSATRVPCDQCLESEKIWSENAIFSLKKIRVPEISVLILANWEVEMVDLFVEDLRFLPQDFVFDDTLRQQIRSIVLVI